MSTCNRLDLEHLNLDRFCQKSPRTLATRVILSSFKGTFGRELVVLHVTPIMFGKFSACLEVVVWRFE